VFALVAIGKAKADCLSDPTLNAIFAGDGSIPQEGSCCMQDVCGLACQVGVSEPLKGEIYDWITGSVEQIRHCSTFFGTSCSTASHFDTLLLHHRLRYCCDSVDRNLVSDWSEHLLFRQGQISQIFRGWAFLATLDCNHDLGSPDC
jgi:hypothetical protein